MSKKLQAALRALDCLTVRELAGADAGIVAGAAAQLRVLILRKEHQDPVQLTLAERTLVLNGRKVEAVKSVRNRSRLGLAEAKTVVDAWAAKEGASK